MAVQLACCKRAGYYYYYSYYSIKFNVRIEPLGYGRLIIHGFTSLGASSSLLDSSNFSSICAFQRELILLITVSPQSSSSSSDFFDRSLRQCVLTVAFCFLMLFIDITGLYSIDSSQS